MNDQLALRLVVAVEALVSILRAKGGSVAGGAGPLVATDADLDGQYGDPLIKKDPRDWNGASYVNQHMSDAPADYLELLAGFLDWKAGKNADDAAKETDPAKKSKLEKWTRYARVDAGRARGWALRKQNGWVPRGPAQEDLDPPMGATGTDGEIPF